MKEKYIQLPPLSVDLPAELVGMIWLYAKMPKDRRSMLLEFMNVNVYGDAEDISKTELSKIINETDRDLEPDLLEYVELMKKFFGILLSQACETAGFVYQHYCIEGKSLEEISKDYRIDEESLQLITQYYSLTSIWLREKGCDQ